MAPPQSKYDDYDFPTTAPEPQSGHPGHTTPEQDAAVHQFRAELEQLGYTERLDTLTLLRFLRARKFDIQAAKTMYVLSIHLHATCALWRNGLIVVVRFVNCEKWRKEFGTDDLVRDFNYVEKPKVFEYYPQYYHKTDKVCSFSEYSFTANYDSC